MRSNAEYVEAMRLVAGGESDPEIARQTGISRSTIRDWRKGVGRRPATDSRPSCARCGHPQHDYTKLPSRSYAYLLGMYLGDGSIDRMPRTWRLRIALDTAWPEIISECADAIGTVFPANQVLTYRPDPKHRGAVIVVYSNQLLCLFPQHGPGVKHMRPIKLVSWQAAIVREHPQRFLRGLIHSDGCRFDNCVRVGGKSYAYPRYNFTNASDDIRGLFTSTCDLLGIEWRRMNARNISVARRDSVARLDEFVGPKS